MRFLLAIATAAGASVAIAMAVSAYSSYFNPQDNRIIAVSGLLFPMLLGAHMLMTMVWLAWRKWTNLVLSLIVLAACGTQAYTFSPLNITKPIAVTEHEKQFTVLTYNVFGLWCFGNEVKNDTYNIAVSNILKADADIVALQECYGVDKNRALRITEQQSDSIKERYPYRSFSSRDVMLLSKYPITESNDISGRNNNYSATRYSIDIDGRTISFYNIHLQSIGLSDDDKELYENTIEGKNMPETRSEAKALAKDLKKHLYTKIADAMSYRSKQAQDISEFLRRENGDVILCGDFNDTANSYAYRKIRGTMSDAYCDCGFGPTITYHGNRFYLRIDHILYQGAIRATDIERPHFASSDHYPLLATFALE